MKPFWLKLKNETLGENYDLSFCFIASDEMQKLNRLYRKKDYSANVLSFPLSKNEGEILINKIYKETAYADYLFIHSLLHLKGLKHGSKMDKEEIEIMQKLHPQNWEEVMTEQ